MIGHYTVVYRVEGHKSLHDQWWQHLRPLFLAKHEPIRITSISKCDEVLRLACIEDAVGARGIDNMSQHEILELIKDLLICDDPIARVKGIDA